MWPLPLDHVTQFIAYLSCIDFSPTSVKCYIAGLNFYSKLQNYGDIANNFVVRKMLEGMKRVKSRGMDTRLPITLDLLRKILVILPKICSSNYESILFTTAFVTAFFAFLRVGEVTVSNSNSLPNHTIMIKDVIASPSNVQLYIASSKTDQFATGINMLISEQLDEMVCPVRNLRKFLGIRPHIEGPLFCHFGGNPLTRYQFTSMLKRALCTLGISQTNYGSHSFRIGCATHAAMQGFSDEEIQLMGRWKSKAYKNYIRIPRL